MKMRSIWKHIEAALLSLEIDCERAFGLGCVVVTICALERFGAKAQMSFFYARLCHGYSHPPFQCSLTPISLIQFL